jgi:hypothetical protein
MLREFVAAAVVGCASVAMAAPINSYAQPVGDGIWHDELGTANDYFAADGSTIGVRYYFAGTSDTLSHDKGFAQFSLSPFVGLELHQVTLNLHLKNVYANETPTAGVIRHRTNASTANGNASQRLEGDVVVATLYPDTPTGGLFSVDVTSQVLNDLAQGYAFSAFSFHATTTSA